MPLILSIEMSSQQQPIVHQNNAGRPPPLSVYDATKFVKQSWQRQNNESSATSNINSNSIRNSVRKSNESVTSQENSNENNRFPNTRNRFHPLSTSKPISAATPQITTPPTTTTTESSAADQRQNRIPISSRFGTSREQNTSVRINKFLRQPIYTSRENPPTSKRINVTHNGSANGPSASQEVIYAFAALCFIDFKMSWSFKQQVIHKLITTCSMWNCALGSHGIMFKFFLSFCCNR